MGPPSGPYESHNSVTAFAIGSPAGGLVGNRVEFSHGVLGQCECSSGHIFA